MNLIKENWQSEDFVEFRNYLLSLKNTTYLDFHKKLIPNSDTLIGIKIPELRSIAKEIVKGDIKSFLAIRSFYHEEKMIESFVISHIKDFSSTLYYLNTFVDKIDNWAVNDSTVLALKIFKKNKDKGLEFINSCLDSDKTYHIRFALVLLLAYYIDEKYIDMVIDKIKTIKSDEYYVQMANAWLICDCYIKFPNKTLPLFDGELDTFTHNKSISKICDSFRVLENDKEKLKQMRRKNG